MELTERLVKVRSPKFVLAVLILVFGIGVYYYGVKHPPDSEINLKVPKTAKINTEVSVPLNITTRVSANAGEFYFSFPKDLLEVKSIDRTGSIYQLWITGYPKFSNELGTVEFAGGLPKPGFIGNDIHIATIIFKVKSAGTATVTLDEQKSRLLANDGLGTKIESFYNPVTIDIR